MQHGAKYFSNILSGEEHAVACRGCASRETHAMIHRFSIISHRPAVVVPFDVDAVEIRHEQSFLIFLK